MYVSKIMEPRRQKDEKMDENLQGGVGAGGSIGAQLSEAAVSPCPQHPTLCGSHSVGQPQTTGHAHYTELLQLPHLFGVVWCVCMCVCVRVQVVVVKSVISTIIINVRVNCSITYTTT